MANVTLSPDEREALNRRIVEAASDAILCFDRDGTIVYGAGKLLRMPSSTLRRRMQKLGIRRSDESG